MVSTVSVEELHAFAADLGLKRSWFQFKADRRHSMPHYDISMNKRRLALGRGAVPMPTRELVWLAYRPDGPPPYLQGGEVMGKRATLAPGTKVFCPRCGRPCVVRHGPRADERPLTCSDTKKGLCANCAVTIWFKKTEPISGILARGGPASLLVPFIQEQFVAIMRAGNCPIDPKEIDWPTVVANWVNRGDER